MKKILLGVSGSVAAIKTLELTQKLSHDFDVRIVLTDRAQYFLKADEDAIRRMGVSIYSDADEWPDFNGSYKLDSEILHIELRRWADLFLIAPASANTIAHMSHGMCPNLLTSVMRAWDWKKPVIVCPAMNTYMWENPVTQEQINQLQSRGAQIVGPISKKLACNDIGMGAMAEVDDIVRAVKR